MNFKLIIIPLTLISAQIIAAPKVENLNHTIGTGIPKISKISADNSYDSISFSFNTGSNDNVYGIFQTVRYSSNSGARLIVISETPGDFNPTNNNSRCTSIRYSQDAVVRWTTSEDESIGYAKCLLNTNKTYYLNIKPYEKCNNGDKAKCTFSLSGSSSYRKPDEKHPTYYYKQLKK